MISEPTKALSEKIERLERENAALRTEVTQLHDPLLKQVTIEPGALEMTLDGATVVVKRMAIAMVTFLEGHNAKNYVEQEISLGTNDFVMLVQRRSGKTPHQLRKEAERERDAAIARLSSTLDLVGHLRRQRAFSTRTFGPGTRTQGVLDHIRKELREIEGEPLRLEEWIDVVLLAFDGAWRAGHDPEAIAAALTAKQAKNEARKWPDWRTADPNKAIEHDRRDDHG